MAAAPSAPRPDAPWVLVRPLLPSASAASAAVDDGPWEIRESWKLRFPVAENSGEKCTRQPDPLPAPGVCEEMSGVRGCLLSLWRGSGQERGGGRDWRGDQGLERRPGAGEGSAGEGWDEISTLMPWACLWGGLLRFVPNPAASAAASADAPAPAAASAAAAASGPREQRDSWELRFPAVECP